MLGRITHNRHYDHTDKHFGQADGVPDVFDCADEKLGEEGDHSRCNEQDRNGLSARPLPLLFFSIFFTASEEMFMSLERKTEHAEIGKEQYNGNGEGELLLD